MAQTGCWKRRNTENLGQVYSVSRDVRNTISAEHHSKGTGAWPRQNHRLVRVFRWKVTIPVHTVQGIYSGISWVLFTSHSW